MQYKKLKTLWESLTTICIGAKYKVNVLTNDDDAMEVIQVVMLIAVGVLAIAAVWAGVNGLLEKWWGIITGVSSQGGPNLTP